MSPSALSLRALLALLVAAAVSRAGPAADDVAERLRVRRIAGVERLLPPPAPLRTDLRAGTIEVSDWAQQPPTDAEAATADSIVEVVLPAGPDGTGTDHAEVFEYQLGSQYTPDGPPRPLVVAYHGYSSSASSVAKLSTIDEECDARGWVYMSVTGIADEVFGTPDAQTNVEAAIRWMLDTHNVDADRVYMIGFSMGAGVVANFAARHRDPDGIMLAAIGLVSGAFDWTQTYANGGPGVHAVMEAPLNFGAPPSEAPFAYRRSSALVFDPATYPLFPGELVPLESMARNLGSTPTYVTWDKTDNASLAKKQGPRFVDLLDEIGATYEKKIVQLTIDPDTGFPAAHSWHVLKEKQCFDFLAQHRAKRRPLRFDALVDEPAVVSFAEVTPRAPDGFARLAASFSGDALVLGDVAGAAEVRVAAGTLVTDAPPGAFATTAVCADRDGFRATLARWDTTPDHAVTPADEYLLGTAPEPSDQALGVPVPGESSVTFDVVDEPSWSARLEASDTVAADAQVLATLEAGAPTAASAWLVVGPLEVLLRDGSDVVFSLPPVAPNVVVPLALVDGFGGVSVPAPPSVAVGLPLRAQALVFDAGGQVVEVSNAQRIDPLP